MHLLNTHKLNKSKNQFTNNFIFVAYLHAYDFHFKMLIKNHTNVFSLYSQRHVTSGKINEYVATMKEAYDSTSPSPVKKEVYILIC